MAVGYRVDGIITATCNLAFSESFTSKNFMMKCLRYYLLEITKEMHQSLKPVSVHYGNKAQIKNIGVLSF